MGVRVGVSVSEGGSEGGRESVREWGVTECQGEREEERVNGGMSEIGSVSDLERV